MKKFIKAYLEDAFLALGHQVTPSIEIASNTTYGDYASNVALQLAKTLRNNPKLLAQEWADSFSKNDSSPFIFSALNGFLNIKLTDPFLATLILEKTEQPIRFSPQTQPLLLEYVSANPTGPLHIGHGRWAVLGHVLENLLKTVGYSVDTEFYINDTGNQIALFYESVNAAKAQKSIPENGYRGHYIYELAAAEKDPLQSNIDSQKAVLDRLGVQFKTWFSEKSLHDSGAVKATLDTLKKSPHTYTQDGALWFKSTDFGDDKDRVLIKADGNVTYFLVDLAYHQNKIEKRGYTRLINIWGADHHGYVQRVRAGIIALCGEQFQSPEKFKVLLGQLVNLYRNGEPVRMSKRTGDMISLEEVVEEIGSDASRYFLIEKNPDSPIDFDLEVAKKTTFENPVYYIQYAHARICSILAKVPFVLTETPASFSESERTLILTCLHLEDELLEAAQAQAPYRIAHYTLELAKAFHAFYEKCPILKAPPAEQAQRLRIIKLTQKTLQICLTILGISAPEKM